MNRNNLVPLHIAGEVYDVLVSLNIGDVVPANVYIRDYANGDIPEWVLREREEHGILTVLTLVDKAQPVGIEIFTCPAKTLAGVLYGYRPGCVKARHALCDVKQHARQIADRLKDGHPPYHSPIPADVRKLKEWNQLSLREESELR